MGKPELAVAATVKLALYTALAGEAVITVIIWSALAMVSAAGLLVAAV
jgi:hypothetical protein